MGVTLSCGEEDTEGDGEEDAEEEAEGDAAGDGEGVRLERISSHAQRSPL